MFPQSSRWRSREQEGEEIYCSLNTNVPDRPYMGSFFHHDFTHSWKMFLESLLVQGEGMDGVSCSEWKGRLWSSPALVPVLSPGPRQLGSWFPLVYIEVHIMTIK